MAKIEEKVENLIKQSIEEKGYQLYDVEYSKEGKDYYLRIFIEAFEKSISIQDCEVVNSIVNPLLDEADIIKDQYFLEVSSTGVEKNLRKEEHYQKAIGKEIIVKLFKKNEKGCKEIEGILKKQDENEITIENSGQEIKIEKNNIAQAKTIYHWE